MMVIRKDQEISQYRERQSRTLRFVRTRALPRSILTTMQSYLRQQLAHGDDVASNAILDTLPPTLSSRIKLILFKDTLASMPLLRSTSDLFLGKLSSRLVTSTMNDNVEILSAGEVAKSVILIMGGAIALVDASEGESKDSNRRHSALNGSPFAADDGSEYADSESEDGGRISYLRSAPAVVGFTSFVTSWRSSVSVVTTGQSIIGSIKKDEYDMIVAECPADGLLVLNNAIRMQGDGTVPASELETSKLRREREELRDVAFRSLRLSCARGDASQLESYAMADAIEGDQRHGGGADAEEATISPLFVASVNGNLLVVRELLRHGALVIPQQPISNVRLLPLFGAIVNGQFEVAEELLNAGASFHFPEDESSPKACEQMHRCLLEAVERGCGDGDVRKLEWMLRSGANPNASTLGDATLVPPLIYACRRNHSAACRALLQFGAVKTAKWNFGAGPVSAYQVAAAWKSEECLELLRTGNGEGG